MVTKLSAQEQFKGVSGWWNSVTVNKWDVQYENWDPHTVRSLNRRKEKIFKLIDEAGLRQGARVLELGFGAGQMARALLERGFEYTGIDISRNLTELAKARCNQVNTSCSATFILGNLDKELPCRDSSFDLVLISGVLHYLYNPTHCVREARRVLVENGSLVIGQRTAFNIGDFCYVRGLVRSLIYLGFREEHELFPSFKSILCDSKLGRFFNRHREKQWMNSPFMKRGHDEYKYVLQKNLFTSRRLKKLLSENDFKVAGMEGAYYGFSENPKYFDANIRLDNVLEPVAGRSTGKFIRGLARINVFRGEKI